MNPQKPAAATPARLPEGFQAFERQRIQPALQELEARRRKHAARMRGLIAVAVLAALFILATLGGIGLPRVAAWPGVLLLVGAGAGAVLMHRRFGYGDKFRQAVTQPICEFLGYEFNARPASFDVQPFVAARIVPADGTRVRLSNHVTGSHRGVSFAACQATMTSKSTTQDGEGNTSSESVQTFEGLLLQYELPRPFPAEARLVPNAPIVGQLLALKQAFEGGRRVPIDHPLFDRSFQVYADDPEQARALLTLERMQGLIELARRMGTASAEAQPDKAFIGHQMSVAFRDRHLLIANRGQQTHFEGHSTFTRVRKSNPAAALAQELVLLRDVVDLLALDTTPPI